MKHFIQIFIFFIFFLVANIFVSQEKSKEPMKLLNSDVMENIGGQVREYRGNVRLQHGNVFSYSDVALQYLLSNKVEFRGNVIIKQNDMTLKSPEIIYDGNTGIAKADKNIIIIDSNVTVKAKKGVYNTNNYIADFEGDVAITDESVTITSQKAKYNRRTLESDAFGNVVVDDDSVTIFSDILHYNRKSKESKNFGNVVIKGKFNNVYLTGDTLMNYPAKKYTFATGEPILFQIDTVPENTTLRFDTLSISADSMEAVRGEETDTPGTGKPGIEKYIFNGNVEIVRGNVFARSKKAVFFKSNELFFLEGNPVVWYDSTQLHADSIIIHIPDNQLEMIHSFGNALAVSRDDTLNPVRKNQIIGYSIKIFFQDKKINKIESIGDAKSLYYMSSEKGNDGVNSTSCDTIYIYFKDDKPLDLVWLGAVEGKYFPENLVWDKVEEYFLPNYRWAGEKPRKKKLILRK
ncbi:OstA-like protein [Bacteroidota bacterium]